MPAENDNAGISKSIDTVIADSLSQQFLNALAFAGPSDRLKRAKPAVKRKQTFKIPRVKWQPAQPKSRASKDRKAENAVITIRKSEAVAELQEFREPQQPRRDSIQAEIHRNPTAVPQVEQVVELDPNHDYIYDTALFFEMNGISDTEHERIILGPDSDVDSCWFCRNPETWKRDEIDLLGYALPVTAEGIDMVLNAPASENTISTIPPFF